MNAQPQFRDAYADLRAREGRGRGGDAELRALPYVSDGPLARQWGVRARTFEAFVARVVAPLERQHQRPLRILDLGAGNGWLSARMTSRGHRAVAVDIRLDSVDGLGAAHAYARIVERMFLRVAASFEQLPLRHRIFDLIVFDASLHYASDLTIALAEAVRVLAPRGHVAILDSPFYQRAESGEAMAREKKESTRHDFPDLADALLAVPAIEYLTPDRLNVVGHGLGLSFRRHRVRYPLWYEVRPFIALLRGRRSPSRFDVWEASIP